MSARQHAWQSSRVCVRDRPTCAPQQPEHCQAAGRAAADAAGAHGVLGGSSYADWQSLLLTVCLCRVLCLGPPPPPFVCGRAIPSEDNADWVLATSHYGEDFVAAVCKGNAMATQFHPEKSGLTGGQAGAVSRAHRRSSPLSPGATGSRRNMFFMSCVVPTS